VGANTTIAWTHHTFNAWIGCHRVSLECDHCYADAGSRRLGAQHGLKLWDEGSDRFFTGAAYWRQPLAWNRAAERAGERHRVFCASYGDVAENRPELIAPRRRLADLIVATPSLDWLLLTKRPENLTRLMPWAERWPRNVWAGTTVGVNASRARIDALKAVPAAIRFLSMEPLLEEVDLDVDMEATTNRFGWMTCPSCRGWGYFVTGLDVGGGELGRPCDGCNGSGCAIDWVIVGGESGPKARRFDIEWARLIRDDCRAAAVAFFMKQLGAKPYDSQGPVVDGTRVTEVATCDRKGSDPAEWPEELRIREVPEPAMGQFDSNAVRPAEERFAP